MPGINLRWSSSAALATFGILRNILDIFYFLFFEGSDVPIYPFFSSDLSWFIFLLDLVSRTFELHVAAKSTLFRFPFYIFLFISHTAVRTVLDRLLVSLGSLNTPNL